MQSNSLYGHGRRYSGRIKRCLPHMSVPTASLTACPQETQHMLLRFRRSLHLDLLVFTGTRSPIGEFIMSWFGVSLVFSFPGLVVASILVNLPFAILPVQRAFETVSNELHDAAACCGMTPWQTFKRIEMPLAWPGVLSAAVLTLGHTLGEFGVVLMVAAKLSPKAGANDFRRFAPCLADQHACWTAHGQSDRPSGPRFCSITRAIVLMAFTALSARGFAFGS